MKNLFFLLLPLFLIFACEDVPVIDHKDQPLERNEVLDRRPDTRPGPPANRGSQLWVCHYDQDSMVYVVIRINERAWPAHERHGDFILPDADGDGYPDASQCEAVNNRPVDCDDSNPDVNPRADEICDNGIDDDCDGLVDE